MSIYIPSHFVPHERVFYRRRPDLLRSLHRRILGWAYYHSLVRMVTKADVLLGICPECLVAMKQGDPIRHGQQACPD